MKRCSNCREIKPLDDFHRSAASKDGHISKCKPCQVAYGRKRRNVKCEACGTEYYKGDRDSFCPHCEKPKKVLNPVDSDAT